MSSSCDPGTSTRFRKSVNLKSSVPLKKLQSIIFATNDRNQIHQHNERSFFPTPFAECAKGCGCDNDPCQGTGESEAEMCDVSPLSYYNESRWKGSGSERFPGPKDHFGIPCPCEGDCGKSARSSRSYGDSKAKDFGKQGLPELVCLSNGKVFKPEPFETPKYRFNDFIPPACPPTEGFNGFGGQGNCGNFGYYREGGPCYKPRPPGCPPMRARMAAICDTVQRPEDHQDNCLPMNECEAPMTGFCSHSEIHCGPECDREFGAAPPGQQGTMTCDPMCMQLLQESRELLEAYRCELEKARAAAIEAGAQREQDRCAREMNQYKTLMEEMQRKLGNSSGNFDASACGKPSRDRCQPPSSRLFSKDEDCCTVKPLCMEPIGCQTPDGCDPSCGPGSESGAKPWSALCARPQTSPSSLGMIKSCLDSVFSKAGDLEAQIKRCDEEKAQLEARMNSFSEKPGRGFADPQSKNCCKEQCALKDQKCSKASKFFKSFRADCKARKFVCNDPELKTECEKSIEKIKCKFKQWNSGCEDEEPEEECLRWDEARDLAVNYVRELFDQNKGTVQQCKDGVRCCLDNCAEVKKSVTEFILGTDPEDDEDSECDPNSCSGSCYCPHFDLDKDGKPVYEGGMCMHRARNYLWKKSKADDPENSYRVMGLLPDYDGSKSDEQLEAMQANPIKYKGGSDLEWTKNYLWGREIQKEVPVPKKKRKGKSKCRQKPKEKKC